MASSISENETTIINVIEEIFAACDTENNGLSKVSTLINYITPFMEGDPNNLVDLRNSLDPFNTDPKITKEVFFKEMKKWVSKFNESEENSDEVSFKSPSQLKIEDIFLPSSTPRASFGTKLIKGYFEVSNLNASNISQRSFLGNEAVEKTFFEEQINELLHQNKKCTDELLQVKLQLASVEELNEALQSDIKKLNKQQSQDRITIEKFESQQKLRESEELNEVTKNARNEIAKIQKIQHHTEKENQVLQEKNSVLETELLDYQEKLNRLHNTNTKHLESINQYKTEIAEKDKEVGSLDEIVKNLRITLNDQLKLLENYEESINCIKEERDKLQKILHNKEKLKRSNSCTHSQQSTISEYTDVNKTPFKSPIKTDKFKFYNFDSPVARICKYPPNTVEAVQPKMSPIPTHVQKTHNIRKSLLVFGDVPCGTASSPFKNKSINIPIVENTKHNIDTEHNAKVNLFNQSFQTPKGDDDEATETPPHMYVIERSGSPRKSATILLNSSINNLNASNLSNISETVSEEDVNWKLQLLSNRRSYSPRNSLRNEFLQVGEDGRINASNYSYKDCTTNYQDKCVQVDDYDELEKQKDEYESTINMLNENYKKLDDTYNTALIENNELKLIRDKESETMVINYKNQIATLQDEHAKLKEEYTRLNNKIAEQELVYLHKIKDLENNITAENTRNLLKEDEIMNDLNRSKLDYESKEKEFTSMINLLNNEHTDVKNRLAHVNEESDEYKKKMLKLEDENDELNVELFNVRNDYSLLSHKLKDAEIDMAQKVVTFGCTEDELNKTILSLKTEMENLTLRHRQDLDETRNQLEACRNCLADLEVKYLSTCGDVISLNKKNDELFKELEAKDTIVNELNQSQFEYKDILTKNEDLEKEVEDLNKNNRDLEQNVKILENQVDLLKRRASIGSMATQIKTNSHSKMVLKQEKLLMRIDYLEEQLRSERQRTSTLEDKFKSTHTNVRSNFTLRLPTEIIRPVSPDSPNYEINNLQKDKNNEECIDSSKPFDGFVPIEDCSSNEMPTTSTPENIEKDVNVSVYEDAIGLSRPMYVLENLGHHYEDIKNQNLSYEKLEKLFTNIVLQFRLDSASMRSRYNTAFAKLNQEEMASVTVIQDVTATIRKHFSGDTLTDTETQMQNLLQHSMHSVRLGVQYGALTQEQDHLQTINVITNYVYLLKKQVVELTEKLSRCIKCKHELVMVDEFVSSRATIPLPTNRRSLKPNLTFIVGSIMFIILAYLHLDTQVMDLFVQAFQPHLTLQYPNGPPPQ